MKELNASNFGGVNLLHGYHKNCMLDNYFQQYIPYYIYPVVVICADR